ncbi:MAG: hypothetical protein GMKNLPBB_00140 [Myxococcota bacterium]|nr:hypothetical protein [Myxococcota bacterium]
MRIPLEQLSQGVETPVEGEIDPKWGEDFHLNPEEMRLDSGGRYRGKLTRLGTTVLLMGEAEVIYRGVCGRCLKDIEFRQHIPMHSRILPGKTSFELEDNPEEDDGGSDVDYYYNGVVDVDRVVRDMVAVEIPQVLTCENPENCGPLPSVEGAAPEKSDAVDPRWAPLLKLKTKG